MLRTVRAIVHDGKVELLEPIELPEGTNVLVTILEEDEHFWLQASQLAIDTIWNNDEDDVYARLLEK